jgi:tetratricopeptide (TPR) repeat protein
MLEPAPFEPSPLGPGPLEGTELEPMPQEPALLEPAALEPMPGDVLAPMSPQEFEAVPVREPADIDMHHAQARASQPPGEIEEILDEAEFFVAQGLWEEARDSLDEALINHPNHPLLLEKMQEVNDAESSSAVPSLVPSEAPSDQSFQLAERLAEELGAPPPTEAGSDVLDVEAVFAQFKKGVEEQIGLEDSDTHYDLGIAYKEMQLYDDAVSEFELAMRNPQKECLAQTMIGLCFVLKGEISEAISHFKKGLYSEVKTDHEELGLYFELGAAYELLKDPKEALYYYQKVQKRDATFRSVEDKIKSLSEPQAQQQAETAPDVEQDDVDRAFDDLMGGDDLDSGPSSR